MKDPPGKRMILMAKPKAKPAVLVDAMMNVPLMVKVLTLTLRVSVLIVTVMPAGMMIEQSPVGMAPTSHVVNSSNAPD